MVTRRPRPASSGVARLLALAVAAAFAAGSCGLANERAAAPARPEPAPVESTTSTTARPAPTTTTTVATTTTPPTTATTVPPTTTTAAPPTEPEVLESGVSGPRTLALQQRLTDMQYDPGPLDGEFGSKTTMAVWAFEQLHGHEPDGKVTPALWAEMQSAGPPEALRPDGGANRTEIDIARQVLVLYVDGAVRLITHVSTGSGVHYCEDGHCGTAVTPPGNFAYTWRYDGWRTSYLGQLYNPVYFNGGIAVHGATSVPSHPASHGCVRIPMHIAGYFPSLVVHGDPVYVL